MFFWKKKKKDEEPADQEIQVQIGDNGLLPPESETSKPGITREETPSNTCETSADSTEEAPAPKKGFFTRLKERLSKTKSTIIEQVKKVIRLHGRVDEELLEQIEEILIQADVGVDTTTKIITRIREEAKKEPVEGSEAMIALFKRILLEIILKHERLLTIGSARPFVILVVGVNGTGKTTTIGKLARHFRNQGLSVMLVAGDTFRAAAVEQLHIWSDRTESDFISQAMGADPASVCFDALNSALSRKTDVVLIDTAGRLLTKVNLMAELTKVVRVIKKVIPDAPHETLLVLDATTGQNAVSQMKTFSEAVPVTGVVMTKLDGTAKGGILIAVRDLFDVPVLKIGIGEQVDDLRDFNPQEFVDALFEE